MTHLLSIIIAPDISSKIEKSMFTNGVKEVTVHPLVHHATVQRKSQFNSEPLSV